MKGRPHHPTFFVGRDPASRTPGVGWFSMHHTLTLSAEKPVLSRETHLPKKKIKVPQVGTVPGIDIAPLCKQLRKLSKPNAILVIDGASITADLFDQLTRDWKRIELFNCIFEPGWWAIPTNVERNAFYIKIGNCVAAPLPPELETGFLAWPNLECIQFEDSFVGLGTSRRDPGEPPIKPHGSAYPWAVADLSRALWHSRLDCYSADNVESVDFLAQLPVVARITTISITESPITAEIFDWIMRHTKLKWLWISWAGFTPDWSNIRKLNKLRHLDAHCPALDDDQLEVIVKSTKLWGLFNEESTLTSKSLRIVIESPYVAWWWAPASVFAEPVPPDLHVDKDRDLEISVEIDRSVPSTIEEWQEKFPQIYWDVIVAEEPPEE